MGQIHSFPVLFSCRRGCQEIIKKDSVIELSTLKIVITVNYIITLLHRFKSFFQNLFLSRRVRKSLSLGKGVLVQDVTSLG